MDEKIFLTQNGALGPRDTEYTIAHSIYASAIEKNGILDISALYLRASRSTTRRIQLRVVPTWNRIDRLHSGRNETEASETLS
jgi:hypothetical protein